MQLFEQEDIVTVRICNTLQRDALRISLRASTNAMAEKAISNADFFCISWVRPIFFSDSSRSLSIGVQK
jgi:hypothetical protein